nr:apolipoprotein N-acyltransferase [Oceanococcus sp. HetDA_MAG_MS8]
MFASLLAGATLVLGFAPLGWSGLMVPVLALWLNAALGMSPRVAARHAWALGFGLYLAGVSWVFVSVHHFGGAPLWLAVVLVLALAAYLAVYLGAAVGLAWWLSHNAVLRLMLALPATWWLFEQARAWVLGGFPWLNLGYGLSNWPGADGVLALAGVDMLGLLLWWMAGAAVLLIRGQKQWAVTAGLAAAAFWALCPPSLNWTQPHADPMQVALVQGNMPQDQKWRPQNLLPTLEMYTQLSLEHPEAELIIWPEVAVPASRYRVESWFEDWDDQARNLEQVWLVGVITRRNGHPYNTMYALGGDGGHYVKQKLVPFGEYFPVPQWVRPVFDWLNLPFTDIRTDMESDRFLYAHGVALAISICFESVFAQSLVRRSDDAGLQVTVTNDAWFAGTLAPAQHLQIAQARAAETGRPLLRVANTGITAVISPQGELLQQLGWGQRGVLTAQVQPRLGITPYMRWGAWPLILWQGTVLGALFLRRILSSSRRRFSALPQN